MRNKIISLILFDVLLNLGCAHTNRISVMAPPSTFDRMNALIYEQTACITLVDDRQFIGQSTRITSDSTCWLEPTTKKKFTVPTSEIKSLVIQKRWRGALEGLGVGALTGTASGAFIGGVLVGGNEEGIVFPNSAGENALGFGILLGGTGGLIGFTVGAIAGSKDKYIFEKPTN